MRLRPTIAILVCGVTALCPLLCAAEAALHAQGGAADMGRAEHRHECESAPHEHEEESGDPIPHGNHSCICVAGTSVAPTLRIPALAPSALIDTPADWRYFSNSASGLSKYADGLAAELSRPPPNSPLLI